MRLQDCLKHSKTPLVALTAFFSCSPTCPKTLYCKIFFCCKTACKTAFFLHLLWKKSPPKALADAPAPLLRQPAHTTNLHRPLFGARGLLLVTVLISGSASAGSSSTTATPAFSSAAGRWGDSLCRRGRRLCCRTTEGDLRL